MASQPNGEAANLPADEAGLFKQLEEYDWDADTEFQSGLQAILGSTTDPTRAEHLTLRARCFYFSRKRDARLDFNRYLSWRARMNISSSVNGAVSDSSETVPASSVERRASVAQQRDDILDSSEPPAPYPTSFEQIVELISTGQPIPGIKDVPDIVLEGQASRTSAARRKKPWEKENEKDIELERSEGMPLNA